MNKYYYNVQLSFKDDTKTKVIEIESHKKISFKDFINGDYIELIGADGKEQYGFLLDNLKAYSIVETARCEDINNSKVEMFEVGDPVRWLITDPELKEIFDAEYVMGIFLNHIDDNLAKIRIPQETILDYPFWFVKKEDLTRVVS